MSVAKWGLYKIDRKDSAERGAGRERRLLIGFVDWRVEPGRRRLLAALWRPLPTGGRETRWSEPEMQSCWEGIPGAVGGGVGLTGIPTHPTRGSAVIGGALGRRLAGKPGKGCL